ncbi:hypothetical protein ACIKT0_17870, partial [Hansschlegelia beijingensis]|uniref:hypothetical protein n=1 Tax=Hansschlegelia beijingensis TaxID=1133344 RepID=UPI00387F2661
MAPEEEARPLIELSERLAHARRAGDPAPEELERLVGMLAQRVPEADDRLTKALEGLARWAEILVGREDRGADPGLGDLVDLDHVRHVG